MAEKNAHVPEPELSYREATPISQAFGDVYFSRAGGVAETTHVFLAGNDLPARWMDRAQFTIGELGFGTGLNFLVTLKAFRASGATAQLDYIAIEKFPFTRERLVEVLALQPELAAEAAELLAAYPLRLPGMHALHFGKVRLILCFGDVAEMLGECLAQVDAWFLDGFSPAKNPEMWSEDVLKRIGELSTPGATFATFTAAGAVKRGLMAAGFAVEKVAGFGHKREMLVGVKPAPESSSRIRKGYADTIIIGAGIAGATLARALAERGVRVTLLERHRVAHGASGNAAGVLFPQLTKRWTTSAAFYFTAYGFMLRQLARWRATGLNFAQGSPGMLRLPRHAEEAAQLENLNAVLGLDPTIVHWVPQDEASEKAGVALASGAAFFPQGTWISPQQLCGALLQHAHIMLREEAAALSLTRTGDGWCVKLADGEVLTAENICIASAAESSQLLVDYKLSLNHVGGQVSVISARDVAANLRSILCHQGYVIPLGDTYLAGATYHRDNFETVTEARHQENMQAVEAILPGWFNVVPIAGRSSLRATTPDRLPMIGMLDEGLYISTGHGSRGLLSAPLAAEIIASMVMKTALPITQSLARAVDPKRFKR